ncbi:hypothetical protein Anas_12542 [Armadillidium nasatum]|uniref:Uncharacterized protein n=1 Tax=Armadillidium nasatum TaxID=96803 RepID=A0A5N5TAZ5_9CRUS|nr:hypothetical protein Anas_12542 [Armadillidium nasatum]
MNMMENIDIKEILIRTSKGKIVLRNYELHGNLERAHRDDMVQILVDYCIEQEYCMMESVNKVLQFYANLIPKLFPTEDSHTYFIPPQTDGIQQKRAKGKFIERYRNVSRKFRQLGLYSKQNFKSRTEKSVKSIILNEGDHLSEEDYFEKQQWLKFNREPWELVEQIWKETSANRISVIHQKDESTISSTLLDWPILEHANGYSLINIDFTTMFGTSVKFYLKWNMNKESIKRLMMERIKDKTWKNVLKSVYPENSGGEDAVLLYLLPLLLKPKKFALPLKKNTFWKPSKDDMQEAFVILVQNPEDVPVTISRKQEKLSQMSLSMQPFVILQGKDLLNIDHCYVVLNDILYGFDSPLKAIENCFKVFHVAHARYPFECESVWLFIQKYFFEIETEWDKTVSDVCELISDIISYNIDEISD